MAPKLNLFACAVLALAGCSTTPHFDDHFGEAVRANLSAQVANPAHSNNANPATGIDGHAARAAQERYEKSFTQSDNKQTLLIGTNQ